MIKPEIVKLSRIPLNKLILNNIIYSEIAEGGAMGNDGGIIIYVMKGDQFILYETNLYTDESTYIDTRTLLLKYQNGYKNDDNQINKILFDYHYGGMGNHIFINKSISLKKGNGFFVYRGENNKEYQISCSVEGVFNCVKYSMENSKTD